MADSNFYTKLIAVQKSLKAPKGQYNSFGKYKYRSCEDILTAVKPLLAKEGLILTLSDEVLQVGERFYIRANATISDGNTTFSTTALAREEEVKKGMDGSQITGTASSYARKYALNGLFLIDDTRDADTDEYHEQTQSAPTAPKRNEIICTGCGKPIVGVQGNTPQQVANATKKKFGQVLCYDCGKKISDQAKAIEQMPVSEEEKMQLPFPIEDA